ncbi:hypothetical protein DN068_11755 [Taibaiella soli]|uniref:Uncharacterized protein n=2 Tax=Taibaiella soli TaxID=1649169 RepID=A0A2W2BXE6_9BACT|nr:hypothetical protein DN068_11755 [Taibaiella soli]
MFEQMEKHQMFQDVEVSDLSGKTVVWESQDKEFFTDEGKYDVVSVNTVGGKKLYTCVRDYDEEENTAGYANLWQSKKGNQESVLLKVLTKLFSVVCTIQNFSCTVFLTDEMRVHCNECQHSLISTFFRIPTPPPQVL